MILTEVTFKQGLEAKQLSNVALGESGRRGSMDNGYKQDFFFVGGRSALDFHCGAGFSSCITWAL